ncbi:DUF4838 domain-containing protein [Flavobacterium gyeonganense]|uniref:DUF4838 domain-containing protein n=1 Tax=Flavobacterium gyeonganense TaxID=1310418 RepID=A0ABV5H6R5_9FLAO|nr:DUF4838 domain-containing protein [Flavobacterium gyeonganense]
MAQDSLHLANTKGQEVIIVSSDENTQKAAVLLKTYLDQAFDNPFLIQNAKSENTESSKIILDVNQGSSGKNDSFIIKSDEKNIYLIGSSEKTLRYAIYTLLETWGFRKYTAKDSFIPKLTEITFPKNFNKTYKPSFEYRALFYPDCYDENFREWHKLDWHIDDFGIWGHSFYKLISAKEYFKTNPDFFALYEGRRNTESLCMTNDTVLKIVSKKMTDIISQNPNARFFSISQNDDVVYCECDKCKALNEKHGGPQGSLYHFLNKIAAQFPKTNITTLAYLHTYQAPKNIKIEPNIYTIFCPIEMNRGKPIEETADNNSFVNILNKWNTTTDHLYLWDYTVEFTNYLSPFPNFHTFSKNYKLYKQNKVKGLFVQGYADIAGDLYELRQYLLAKIIWDTDTDAEAVTNDFINGFYDDAAPFVKKYIDFLIENQEKSNRYLDIYTSPIEGRNTFLSPAAMDQYDQLISQAEMVSKNKPVIAKRVLKLRLALEYVYFEQAKFYGKEPHGMFQKNGDSFFVKDHLKKRVQNFVQNCTDFGIYELSEEGLSPEEYSNQWNYIAKNNVVDHVGENLKYEFLTKPEAEFNLKKENGIQDGIKGYKDFNLNWTGWYGQNAEIIINCNNTDFNSLEFQCLEDQRHWIFPPSKIIIKGFKNHKWKTLKEKKESYLTENYDFTVKKYSFNNISFRNFDRIKVILVPEQKLPAWRERKNKKPMLMIDEIILK